MPISMHGNGRKNPNGPPYVDRQSELTLTPTASRTVTFTYTDIDPNPVNNLTVTNDINSPTIGSSGIQLHSLDFALKDESVGISKAQVERIANTSQNGSTYLTYQITLSLDPSSTQNKVTVGAMKPSSDSYNYEAVDGTNYSYGYYPGFYFSDLKQGTNGSGGLAIAGNGQIDGTTARDCLNGGDGNDTIDGHGGADYMRGGSGNDTYIVRDVNTDIDESPQTGIETVVSYVDWSLSQKVLAFPQGENPTSPQTFTRVKAATGLDNLTLMGDALVGNGNYLSNQITGNDKNNILNGFEAIAKGVTYRGETRSINDPALQQKDILTGGGGADTFLLGDASGTFYLEKGGNDYALITDFKGDQRTSSPARPGHPGRPTPGIPKIIPGDKIQMHGDLGQYDLKAENRGVGRSDLDVAIYFTQGGQQNLIGVVQDTAISAVRPNLRFV